MLAHFPFSLAVDLEAAGIDHQVQRGRAGPRPQGNRQFRSAPRQGAIAGHGQRHLQQGKHRAGQTLGRTQRQMIDGTQGQHAANGRLRIHVLRAPLRRPGITPRRECRFIDPQRQAATPDQGGVILRPIADAIGRLPLHAVDVSNVGNHGYSCNNTTVNHKSLPPVFLQTILLLYED